MVRGLIRTTINTRKTLDGWKLEGDKYEYTNILIKNGKVILEPRIRKSTSRVFFLFIEMILMKVI